MPIPDADSAFVPAEKLSGYLLNLSHPVGGPKARWYLSIGYRFDRPAQLEADLLRLVSDSSDYVEIATPFGVKYVVRGEIEPPDGGRYRVLSVWITEKDDFRPRLVSAYPDE